MTILRPIAFAVLALGAIFVPAESNAQVTSQGGGYLFRFKYTPKQKLTYKMNISSAMMKAPMVMTMTMLTKSVTGSQAEMDYTVKSSGGGQGMPEQKISVTVDNRGKILKSSSPGAGQLSNLQLPEKPVKVGDTWTGTMNTQGMATTSTYKFVGLKNMGGVPCAQISVSVKGGMAQMKVTGNGMMYVRVADGSLQGSQVATVVNMTPPKGQGNGQPMNIKTDISITRG